MKYQNWAGNQQFNVQDIVYPESIGQIQKIIETVTDNNLCFPVMSDNTQQTIASAVATAP